MEERLSTNPSRFEVPPTAAPFHIVGVGASAGGLEALESLFERMPRETGMAFVVLQHLSPDFESHMQQLLSRKTSIPILQVVDGLIVQPNTIYLIPPGKEMIISGGRLHLTDKDPDRLSLPIDVFFRSLANDQGRWAVGVVLSGTGSDASRGVRAIHDAGGLVIAQSEETAKFDGMPKAALQTRVVDMVLAPADIPRALVEYSRRSLALRRELLVSPDGSMPPPLEGMERIFELLRAEYGIDFAHYKPSTVFRRVDRRLAMVSASSLEEYAGTLQQSPAELDALYQDLLIGVTRFFRDGEAFEHLERHVLPSIIANTASRDEIRIWCAGCATGEEPYSIAILLHELLQASGRPLNVKIFATDVHRASLEFAGAGTYDESALSDVSPARLQRYFVERDGRYHVVKEVRQMIVFAAHNVINDAPFTRLDLLTCRNLLIYFQPPAQKKAMSVFHFGLKAGGHLFLGPSETPGELADEFDVQEKHWKIYRKRRDVRLPTALRMPTAIPVTRRRGLNGAWTGSLSENTMLSLYDRVLGRYMPPGLLVDEHYNLMHTFGGAERFVRVPPGRPTIGALDLLLPELKTTVAGALQHATKEGKLVRYGGVPVDTGGDDERVLIQVEPFSDERAKTTSYLITFESMVDDPTRRPADATVDMGQLSRDRIDSLETELRFTKENLQATIEELETSNEELQATNEELVASNEELQSTNEELHSVNEELYTVNAELQRKIGELTETTADLDSVLQTTEVGVLFLDLDLRIRKFTTRIFDAFQLLPQDVGRPIDTFSHKLHHPSFVEDLRTVLATGNVFERDVSSADGKHFYFLRALPYRQNGKLAGVVVTLLDIGALRIAERNSRMLSALVESSADGIIATDLKGTVSQWNRGAERMYGFAPAEMIGKALALIVPDDRKAELAETLTRIARGEHLEALETVRRRKDGTLLHVSLQVSPVRDGRGEVTAVSTVDRDITARRMAEDHIRLAVEQRERFLAILSHELRNPLAAVVSASRVLEKHSGDGMRDKALNILKRQSAHMARILDDVLDISRIRQGRLDIRKEPIDLRQVVETALETVGSLVEEKGLQVDVLTTPEPMRAVGDHHRLSQLVVNLLTNAIRHTDANGRIVVSLNRRGVLATLRVRDDGTGIAPDLLPHVFEPFGIAHLKGPRAGGLGIGLWLVKTIAAAHEGSVVVRSEGVGRGTEFLVELPLTASEVPVASHAQSDAIEAKILLVEDQKDIQELTEAILVSVGASVVAASCAEEGLELIERELPDIALVDIGLPGMSGLELAKRVRQHRGADAIRLIAMTGFGQLADRLAVFEAGFDQHLVKPVEIDALLQALRTELMRLREERKET